MKIKSLDIPQEQINSIIANFSSGRIEEALNDVKVLINNYPNDPVPYNICGACYAALGKPQEAVNFYKKSLKIKPDYAEAHNNLAGTLKELGQLDNAVEGFKKSLSIKPDYVEAHNNLGNTLMELDKLDSAIKSYQKAVTIKPDYVEAHLSLGIIYQKLGKLNEAVKSYKTVLEIKPDFADAHYSLGVTLQKLNKLDEAVKSYQKALVIKPEFSEAYNNLGITLKELGQLDAALIQYKKALAINPNYAEAHLNIGLIYQKNGQIDKAIKCYKKSLAIQPNFATAHNNLGNIFMSLGQLNNAVESYKIAMGINPEHAEAHNNHGIALSSLNQQSAALRSYGKAISIKKNFAAAYFNRAELLVNLNRFDDALIDYKSTININPDTDFALGNFLHTKMHLCIWNNLPTTLSKIIEKINSGKKIIEPFPLLALIDDPKIQKKASEIYAKEKYLIKHILPKLEKNSTHEKIRLGYFSADFREHPVANLTAELYETHDRKKFEIYAFSFGLDTNDEMNLRIKAGVDHFFDVHMMSHKEVAILSRSYEIDIAINLGGYTKDARTEIFAIQAAPVQVNYLGYSSTMGVNYMDYLIADPIVIPENQLDYYSENIAYLPYSFMPNDTKRKTSNRIFTREEVGLPINGFVFCCFNNHYKITPNIYSQWMRVLAKVDGSVLWLTEGNNIANNNLKEEAKKHNINENRIIFASRLTLREDHLNRIQLADLFLDTFPCNAHATCSDALQMGLPVLTCKGYSFASRIAASLINSINLPELITNSQEQYELLAIDLGKNQEKLKTIKEKLNNNLPNSPFCNTQLYTQNLESAYLSMYEKCQNRIAPEHIYVKN